MNRDWQNRYEVGHLATHMAGDLAHKIYNSSFDVEWKADESPVTIADRNAESKIRDIISRHFPNDGFLGEEHEDHPGSSGYRWVIDPIDGTRSFVRGIPLWATLVGLEHYGDAIAGFCYIPVLGHTYRALRGEGAFCNDKQIHVSTETSLANSMFCYSGSQYFRKANASEAFHRLHDATDRQRGLGDFYGFMMVAQGSAELMLDHGVHAWDVAALIPILEEAGGQLTNWQGKRGIDAPDALASNGKLHAQALQLLHG